MSDAVYEALAYAMRYWFIAVAVGILIAMVMASYREYKEKRQIRSELSQFSGYLEIIAGPEEFVGDRFGIRPEMNTVGSSPDEDIMLPDGSVAPVHAFLYMEGDRLILEPHSLRHVTQINGRRAVRKHELKTGDVVTVGDISFAVYIRRKRVGYDH
ncbi:MAG: FHA domain-containing protein [Clostridia bacterium]|nr:FHA domain-containing protein [Clostridia bacterium]